MQNININPGNFKRPEIIRPPSEHSSYFLPLTHGCSNNTCTFCNYYGSKLQMREFNETKKEIDAISAYIKNRVRVPGMPEVIYYIINNVWDGKKIFLQDGDALVYPFSRLKNILEYLNEKLPFIERIGAYATAQDVLRRTPEELKELAKLKLGILYMGIESGNEEILKKIGKRVNTNQLIEAGKKVRKTGINLSCTVILGLGSLEESEKHIIATARVLSEIDPEFAAALTLTLVPGTPIYRDWQEGRFKLITPFDSLKELKLLIETSKFSNCFFSSMHASNYFSIRGTLPEQKKRLLNELDQVLRSGNPALLRPEYLRGL
ncbi:MAG: radical SAM protein [Chloroflexi bacterium]|nr:radical SAM protein [Chloroflexota bacterium]